MTPTTSSLNSSNTAVATTQAPNAPSPTSTETAATVRVAKQNRGGFIALDSAQVPSSSTSGLNDEFFRQFPPRFYFKTSKGEIVPVPFLAKADAMILHFTASSEAVKKRLAGTGLCPIETDNGRALGALYIMNYVASGCGAYQEAILTFPTSEKPKTIPWVNAFSAALPSFDPTTVAFSDKLLLNNDAAIDFGREWGSFDKSKAQITVERQGNDRIFSFNALDGNAIFSGAINEKKGVWNALKSNFGLMRAMGFKAMMKMLWNTAKMAIKKQPISGKIVNRSLEIPGLLQNAQMQLKVSAQLQELGAADQLKINAATEFGKILSGLQPEFVLAVRANPFLASVDLHV